MSEITSSLQQRYSVQDDEERAIVEMLEALWVGHRPLADPHFVEQFCSGDEAKFVQRYTEMRIGQMLRDAGWHLESAAEGPDFKAIKQARMIWVEAVTPTAGEGRNRLPEDYLCPLEVGARAVPSNQILLRITAAIEEKHRKMVGELDSKGRHQAGYLKRGIVHEDDPYLIAINTELLGSKGHSGISGLPTVLEAVSSLGPQFVNINVLTMQAVQVGFTCRPALRNANEAVIRTDAFFQAKYAPISAIIGIHERPETFPDLMGNAVVVHNPGAKNKLLPGSIKRALEYRWNGSAWTRYRHDQP